MEEPFNQERILNSSLRELTQDGGERVLLERLHLEVDRTSWDYDQKERVKQLADTVVTKYHEGDTRDDNTYATHILRVACRILSGDHFAIRDNPDLIIAALLHDTIEDRPERLLDEEPLDQNDYSPENLAALQDQRDRALYVIKDAYGQNVTEMVEAVSNPIYDKTKLDQNQRQEFYRHHIRELMASESDARYIKLSDFIDNCLGLEFNPEKDSRYKLAQKYRPLLPNMLEYVINSDIHEVMKNKLETELFFALELCNKIIESDGEVRLLGEVALNQPPQEPGHESFFESRDHLLSNH